jgi:hypothetical protein
MFRYYAKAEAGVAYNIVHHVDGSSGYTVANLITNNRFNGLQLNFIYQILAPLSNPIPANHFEDIQDAILNSSLTEVESAPLLVGLAIALSSQTYWEAAEANVENPWHGYMGIMNVNQAVSLDMEAFYDVLFDGVVEFASDELRGHHVTARERNDLFGRASLTSAAASAIGFWFPV